MTRARATMLAMLTWAAATAWPAVADQTDAGANCALTSPPPEAGELAIDDQVHLIVPRRKALGRDYRGCQAVWAEVADQWKLERRVRIDGEKVVLEWVDGKTAPCIYRAGRFESGSARHCAAQTVPPYLSLPGGCYQELRDTGSIPARCTYE